MWPPAKLLWQQQDWGRSRMAPHASLLAAVKCSARTSMYRKGAMAARPHTLTCTKGEGGFGELLQLQLAVFYPVCVAII